MRIGPLLTVIASILPIATSLSLPLDNKKQHEAKPLSSAAINELRVFVKYAGASNCYVRNWQCGEYCQGGTEDTQLIQDFFDPRTNTFAYIAVNTRLARVLAVFRCTVDLHPWLNGLIPQKINVDWIEDPRVEIHTDFAHRYTSVEIHSCPCSLIRLDGIPPLSTIAATHFDSLSISNIPLQLFTFGAPRIGNPEFAAYVNKHLYRPTHPTNNGILPSIVRVVHYNDFVPRLELKLFDYQHNNAEAWISEPQGDKTLLCHADPLRREANCADRVLPFLSMKMHNYYYGIGIGTAARCVIPAPTHNLIRIGRLAI
ncbi:Alpha/Beta hydrolase protein [Syncephalis plumigaleata]|nr:Alpha/Beta hydrolase protein [Syncephalis plumigaleata]